MKKNKKINITFSKDHLCNKEGIEHNHCSYFVSEEGKKERSLNLSFSILEKQKAVISYHYDDVRYLTLKNPIEPSLQKDKYMLMKVLIENYEAIYSISEDIFNCYLAKDDNG